MPHDFSPTKGASNIARPATPYVTLLLSREVRTVVGWPVAASSLFQIAWRFIIVFMTRRSDSALVCIHAELSDYWHVML